MRTLPAIARIGIAVGLAFSAAGCSDDWIDGPPDPSTVRVFIDREFDYTWQMSVCESANDESLTVTGSDGMGGAIFVEILDGSGTVSIVRNSAPITGAIDRYEMDDDRIFTAKGDYEAGGESGPLELEGNCS